MIIRVRRLFRSPVFLLGLTAFLVQSGELGTSDTTHRLQTTHSFWTSEPPVFPEEYPEFGIHGRNGKLYASYGMGQSLLMFPSDVVGTYAARLPIFRDYDATDPAVRSIVVSYSTNILICVLTVLVCFGCWDSWALPSTKGSRAYWLCCTAPPFSTTHRT